MLNGIEFQTVGAAYLKALRPTAVLVNGAHRKLCDADQRVPEYGRGDGKRTTTDRRTESATAGQVSDTS